MSMPQAEAPPLVLASASAARRALLEAAGVRAVSRPAAVDEASIKEAARAEDIPPGDAALVLAEAKARRVGRRLAVEAREALEARRPDEWGLEGTDALVIGCDQILTCEGRWFDKPRDAAEAREHLLALRGRTHLLHTAVLCWRGGEVIWRHVATPRLTMRPFSDAVLDAHLAAEGGRATETVGAYRLEGPGVQLFDRVEGEHAAVLGLPLLPLLGFLRQHRVLMD